MTTAVHKAAEYLAVAAIVFAFCGFAVAAVIDKNLMLFAAVGFIGSCVALFLNDRRFDKLSLLLSITMIVVVLNLVVLAN